MKLSFIFHNININYGDAGTEKYIRNQIKQYNSQNINCIVIFQLIRNYKIIEFDYYGIMLNYRYLGFFEKSDIIQWISKLKEQNNEFIDVFIHHLRDFNINSLLPLVDIIGKTKYYFLVHDFYSACTQYNLLKNGEKYCGDAKLYKEKCFDCKFYNESMNLKKSILKLFNLMEEQLQIIIPSVTAKELWCQAYPEYEKMVQVIPHLKLEGKYQGNRRLIGKDENIKVAFVGGQAFNKGWTKWKSASDQLLEQNIPIKLYYFGSAADERNAVRNVYVSVSKMGADAMMKELRKYEIDCVVLFSCVPETYSFTYYEAFAANAFVITNYDSGNIASEVKKNENGIVIDNEVGELVKLFINTEELRTKINEFKEKGILGPQTLLDNFDYMSLDYDDSDTSLNLPKRKRTIKRSIWEFIYRMKYRNYLDIIKDKKNGN